MSAPSPPAPPPLTAGQLLTAGQVAARWQVPKSQIYRLTRAGSLPSVKLGKYYRYRLDAIEEFERVGGLASKGER